MGNEDSLAGFPIIRRVLWLCVCLSQVLVMGNEDSLADFPTIRPLL